MLILNRKVDEKIIINGNITVMVTHIGPHTVRIGIEAPRGIPIVRDDAIVRQPKNTTLDAHGEIVDWGDAT